MPLSNQHELFTSNRKTMLEVDPHVVWIMQQGKLSKEPLDNIL